ncbi:hypothetical protein [Jidongwangia harbinensis]|uniref:hypothetical protein n=1 Tax=Jidongwangia harbinensis TaxID=2878561 RepID=UPI001CD973FD|nr:hypothetical protein [Jidongwangia harbinensis]MCA2212586.1 hypothetical protein [Jidongwangia harbinensis]
MDTEAAIATLRKVAISQLVGRHVGSDRLIQLGLDALLAGIDTPSLPRLAGLTRVEEPDAQELFVRVVAELGLIPDNLPALPVPRAWALVRWWAQLIVEGDVDVRTGGDYIYCYGWSAIPYTDSEPLRQLISSIVQCQDTTEAWAVWDADYATRVLDAEAKVVQEARDFIQGLPRHG